MRRFPGMRMEIRQTTKEKIMGIFSMILSLLSGVALFLFGMSLMGDGLKMVAGNKLEAFLLSLIHISLAIKQGKCNVVQGDVSAIPFSDATFDYVSAFETVYFRCV